MREKSGQKAALTLGTPSCSPCPVENNSFLFRKTMLYWWGYPLPLKTGASQKIYEEQPLG
jgi:hypothetical protein